MCIRDRGWVTIVRDRRGEMYPRVMRMPSVIFVTLMVVGCSGESGGPGGHGGGAGASGGTGGTGGEVAVYVSGSSSTISIFALDLATGALTARGTAAGGSS